MIDQYHFSPKSFIQSPLRMSLLAEIAFFLNRTAFFTIRGSVANFEDGIIGLGHISRPYFTFSKAESKMTSAAYIGLYILRKGPREPVPNFGDIFAMRQFGERTNQSPFVLIDNGKKIRAFRIVKDGHEIQDIYFLCRVGGWFQFTSIQRSSCKSVW